LTASAEDSGAVDVRLQQAPVVVSFARAVQPVAGVLGFYAGGSLASGDFQPGRSDLDLVAVIAAELHGRQRRQLKTLHQQTRLDPAAAKLHCVYVPMGEVQDVEAKHLTWAHGKLLRRECSGIARAELLQAGITVLGPRPAEVLPPLDTAALQAAARREVRVYWPAAVRRPWRWLDDTHVDLGLLTLARAEATLTEGRLITKREALTRLDRLGVDQELAQQIARRRQGHAVSLTAAQRLRRAHAARRLVADGLRTLSPDR